MYCSIYQYYLKYVPNGEVRQVIQMTQQDVTEMKGKRKNAKDQDGKAGRVLEERRIPTQVKLAGLWATVMFMYVYVDIFGFFKTGLIKDILVGKAGGFDITQTWMLSMLMLMTIPALMVYLSLALPAKANRYTNISLGAIFIFIAVGTAAGASGAYYIFGSIVEAILLAQVVWIAWKWPRVPGQSANRSIEGTTTG
jgi:hypothetical protein